MMSIELVSSGRELVVVEKDNDSHVDMSKAKLQQQQAYQRMVILQPILPSNNDIR